MKKLEFNTKFSILFSIIGIVFYIYVYNAFELFYLFKIQSASTTASTLFYGFTIIFIGILIHFFIKIIKNNLKTSKTTKELFSKAGMFTLITFVTLVLIQLALLSPAVGSTMGTGILLFWFILGFVVINLVYYLVILIYKFILKK